MDKAKKFWDKQSVKFERQIEKDEQSFIKTIEKTRKYLKDGDRVLDFACGIGTSSFNMIDYVKEIQAIDISPGMIEVAKKRMNKLPLKNIEFTPTTLFDKEFKSETFDVVTAFNIIHLLDDPKIAIGRIHNLLKRGGVFISSTPFLGEKSSVRFIFYLIKKTGFIPYLKLLKVDEFEKLVVSENFKVLEIDKTKKPTPFAFIVAKK